MFPVTIFCFAIGGGDSDGEIWFDSSCRLLSGFNGEVTFFFTPPPFFFKHRQFWIRFHIAQYRSRPMRDQFIGIFTR